MWPHLRILRALVFLQKGKEKARALNWVPAAVGVSICLFSRLIGDK